MRLTTLLFTLIYFSIGILFLQGIYEIDLISAFSLLYAFFLIKQLFDSLGKSFPFKELIMSIMGLQLIISPFFDYYYFKNEVFGVMRVDKEVYFSYVLPATMALQFGLFLLHPRKTNEDKLFNVLSLNSKQNIRLGWMLIGIGYIFYLLNLLVQIPSSLAFIFVSFAFFRFIGFFYLWFSKSSFLYLGFIIVFIPFFIKTINSAIFIDLLIFIIFILSIYLMKEKISRWKIIALAIIGFWALFILQSVKHSYRSIVWNDSFEGSQITVLSKLFIEKIANFDQINFKEVGAGVNIRLNQGWILTHVMNNIPNKKPIAEGRFLEKEIIGILLPRFLYQEKAVVGDHEKFLYFAGWSLASGVAMNVGIMGDGYGNFGNIGGIIFCFFFGLWLGLFFRIFFNIAKRYPTLPIWGVLIFFYSMRAGNEFYIIANWMIKTSVIVFIYYLIFENKNQVKYYPLAMQSLLKAS